MEVCEDCPLHFVREIFFVWSQIVRDFQQRGFHVEVVLHGDAHAVRTPDSHRQVAPEESRIQQAQVKTQTQIWLHECNSILIYCHPVQCQCQPRSTCRTSTKMTMVLHMLTKKTICPAINIVYFYLGLSPTILVRTHVPVWPRNLSTTWRYYWRLATATLPIVEWFLHG